MSTQLCSLKTKWSTNSLLPDLTANNQKIVKDTIQNLTVKQELPATATNLIITTHRTSCIYFLPKIHKPNNLYTVIPNSEYFFDKRTGKKPSSETLLRLAELVLTLNCFSFAGNYYKQINSVAMGTKMGPSYANLFVGYVEHHFFNQYDGPKPDFYGRYIDDCIGAISSSREELNRFITSFNSFHPALRYNWEISETSLAFLDIKASINGNGLRTSVHYKPTDSHSYLLHSSSHPSHVKNSIPYSKFLRLRRLCSDDSDFSNKSKEMCQFFRKTWLSRFCDSKGPSPRSTNRSTVSTTNVTKRKKCQNSIHPHNNPVKAIILNNFKILQKSWNWWNVLATPADFIHTRQKRRQLSSQKHIQNNWEPGTFKGARSRCKTCPFLQNAVLAFLSRENMSPTNWPALNCVTS